MSSHHIVREKQEPALYIHQLGNFDEENLGQLLEWSPTLIVNASSYEKVISLGLKIDIVVNTASGVSFQENTKSIHVKSDELTDVLEYLIEEKYPAVNIISAESNSLHLKPFFSKINLVVFNETYKSYAVRSGFKIWKPEGTLFQVQTSESFQFTNMRQIDDSEFEVINDGFVEFIFNATYLPISEAL
ncbi:MAG: thiamine pyrophosphokinase [Pedobacter sp.]|nr:MAG: thiamine pyrophosphokinase [Pedobacter sp.]